MKLINIKPRIQNPFRLQAGAVLICLAALVSPVAAQKPREPDQAAQRLTMTPMQTEMTLFILRDLEYTLLSAPPPDADGQTIGVWLAGVKQKLDVLENIAASLRLDPRVNNSVDAVRNLTIHYEIFFTSLININYTTNAVLTKGDGSKLLSGATTALGIVSDSASSDPVAFAVGAVCNTANHFLNRWDASIQNNSLIEKINTKEATIIEQQVQRAQNRYTECLGRLKLSSQSLSADFGIKTPNFTPNGENIQIEKDDSNPFSLASRSFALSRSTPGQAVELLTKAEAAIPSYTGENSEFLSHAYRAPYLLMAAHLCEHGSRVQPKLAAVLGGKSVDLYSKAAAVMGKESGAIPVSYLISRARALTTVGQTTKAKALIAEIKTNLASENGHNLSRAISLYDLATLSSRMGDLDEASNLLRQSFEVKPRRDPHLLRDPALAQLLAARADEVRDLVAHPLTGTHWQSGPTSEIEFYPGGVFLHQLNGDLFAGNWKTSGNSLTLSNRHTVRGLGKPTPDPALTYQIENGSLVLSGAGGSSTLKGTKRSLAGHPDFSSRLVDDSGSWTWVGNGQPKEGLSSYFVSANFDLGWADRKWDIWFIDHDPLKGRVCSTFQLPNY